MFPDSFSFTSTLTLVSLNRGYTVKYIPSKYIKREGKSKIKPVRDTLNFLQLICRTVTVCQSFESLFPGQSHFFLR